MINFDIDKIQKELDGKFNVAHLIVNRVNKLKSGIDPKVDKRMREKEIVLAIREIDSGDLEYTLDQNSTRGCEVEMNDAVIVEGDLNLLTKA